MQHQSSANETLALHCICIYMPKNIITHLFWQTRTSDCSTLIPEQDITCVKSKHTGQGAPGNEKHHRSFSTT